MNFPTNPYFQRNKYKKIYRISENPPLIINNSFAPIQITNNYFQISNNSPNFQQNQRIHSSKYTKKPIKKNLNYSEPKINKKSIKTNENSFENNKEKSIFDDFTIKNFDKNIEKINFKQEISKFQIKNKYDRRHSSFSPISNEIVNENSNEKRRKSLIFSNKNQNFNMENELIEKILKKKNLERKIITVENSQNNNKIRFNRVFFMKKIAQKTKELSPERKKEILKRIKQKNNVKFNCFLLIFLKKWKRKSIFLKFIKNKNIFLKNFGLGKLEFMKKYKDFNEFICDMFDTNKFSNEIIMNKKKFNEFFENILIKFIDKLNNYEKIYIKNQRILRSNSLEKSREKENIIKNSENNHEKR